MTIFDESKREKVYFVFYDEEANGTVQERLIALKESLYIARKVLFDLFKDIMETQNLNWRSYLIGKSYDPDSNISDNYKGLQVHIRNDCPRALFIWCHVHRLDLVVK